jgi:serine/threonine protein kinase
MLDLTLDVIAVEGRPREYTFAFSFKNEGSELIVSDIAMKYIPGDIYSEKDSREYFYVEKSRSVVPMYVKGKSILVSVDSLRDKLGITEKIIEERAKDCDDDYALATKRAIREHASIALDVVRGYNDRKGGEYELRGGLGDDIITASEDIRRLKGLRVLLRDRSLPEVWRASRVILLAKIAMARMISQRQEEFCHFRLGDRLNLILDPRVSLPDTEIPELIVEDMRPFKDEDGVIRDGIDKVAHLARKIFSGEKMCSLHYKRWTPYLRTNSKEFEILWGLRKEETITPTYAICESEDFTKTRLIMPFLEGDLSMVIDETRHLERLPFKATLKIYEDMLRALKGLKLVHDRGYLHRDFKPGNIIGGRLGDFGFSCLAADRKAKKRFRGTMSYCSPHVARLSVCDVSDEEIDAIGEKDDIFSVGVSFYDACHGGKLTPPIQKIKENSRACAEVGGPSEYILNTMGESLFTGMGMILRVEGEGRSADGVPVLRDRSSFLMGGNEYNILWKKPLNEKSPDFLSWKCTRIDRQERPDVKWCIEFVRARIADVKGTLARRKMRRREGPILFSSQYPCALKVTLSEKRWIEKRGIVCVASYDEGISYLKRRVDGEIGGDVVIWRSGFLTVSFIYLDVLSKTIEAEPFVVKIDNEKQSTFRKAINFFIDENPCRVLGFSLVASRFPAIAAAAVAKPRK